MRHLLLASLVALVAGCPSSDVSRSLGARCDVSAECDDRCLAPSPDWPGGFCTITCDTHTDCPADAACIDEDGGVCAFTCGSDPACRFLGPDYACKERNARADATKVMVCRGD
jgi:hypothetical protein